MTFDDFIREMENTVDRTIKVDTRETVKSKEMLNLVKEQAKEYEDCDFDVKSETLEVGDYAYKNIGIERKEGDFIKIGDVLTKAEELKEAYDYAYILISSDLLMLKEQHKERKQVDSLEGLVASLVAREVSPIFCSSRTEMVTIMLKIFDKVSDDKDRTIRNPIRPQPTTDDWKEHILRGLPHVGSVKAEELLFEFGTVRDAMTASKKQLKRVDGIGDKIASNIIEVISK